MQVVVQRVAEAKVQVEGETVGEIGVGLLALVGISSSDDDSVVEWMARKVAGLRIFADEEGRFARSVRDVSGSILSVSQFTLLGDASKGTRPSFTNAARPELARPLWQRFNTALEECGVADVQTGVFGASMQVSLVNDGPVTILLER